MQRQGRKLYRYSSAFKKKVVNSVESGKYNVSQARLVFGCSFTSIYKWLKKYGKNYKIGKVIKVHDKTERERIKELEEEVKHLRKESEMAKLKCLAFESLIEVANEEFQVDIKKL